MNLFLEKLWHKEFYCQEYAKKYYPISEKEHQHFQNSECCFTHIIGLPKKHNLYYPLFDFQEELFKLEDQYKNRVLKKATGTGGTEIKLRRYTWKATKDNRYRGAQGCIVVGPRIELAISLIDRIKAFFPFDFGTKNTVVNLNGCRIESFPSHHLATMRGLPNVVFILKDEFDFFPKGQQLEARAVTERYMAKGNPETDDISTPNQPDGLLDQIEKETKKLLELGKKPIYHIHELHWNKAVGRIFTQEEIDEAMKSPSFPREYGLQYGYGSGDIYSLRSLAKVTKVYPKVANPGCEIEMDMDPAWGSSKFAIMIWQNINGKMQILLAEQYDRPSITEMCRIIRTLIPIYNVRRLRVDSANPEIISEFSNEINTIAQNFRETGLEMLQLSANVVEADEVEIHEDFEDLLKQLRAAKRDAKNGDVDKKLQLFDLGDTFRMGCYGYKKGGGYSLIAQAGSTSTKSNSSNKYKNLIDTDDD